MKHLVRLCILLIFSQSCFAQSEPEVVKLSAFLHLSGDYAMEGSAFREGLEIALENINHDLSRKYVAIKLDFQDTRYPSNEVVTLAHRAIADIETKGLIVSTLAEIKPIAPIIEQAKLPAVVLWDATPEMDNFGDYTFSIGPWAPDTGQKCARFAIKELNAKKVAIMHQQHDWSISVTKAFEDKFSNSERTVFKVMLNPEESDFKTPLLKLKTSKPDIVYAPMVFAIHTFVKQYKTYFPNTPLIMSDNITEHLISQDPKSFEGIYHSAVANPDNDSSKRLVDLYKKKYGKPPTLLMFNAWGYDSLSMYGEVIKNGARTREEIKDALYKIKNLNGAGGDITVLPTGSAPKYISMFQVRAGKLELVSGPDPE